MMFHRTGLDPADPDRKIKRVSVADHELIRDARASLSGAADLRPFGWGVLDQSNCSGCWAHSLTTALYRRRKIQGEDAALMSPLYFMQTMYAQYRASATPIGQALPPLQDNGAQLDDADKCAAQWGAIPFQTDQQGGGTDVPATTDANGNPIPLPEITVANAESGFTKAFSGEYDIPINDNAPETAAACLDAKRSVWIGGPVSSALDSLGPNDIEQPCSVADTEGGHAREVVGYRTVNGVLEFLIENSWGSAWAMGGYSWAAAGVISGAWSLLPFQVTP